jgi:hypothetical protein
MPLREGTRRQFLVTVPAAGVAATISAAALTATWRLPSAEAADGAGAIPEPERELTRFLMKRDYPRLEVKAKAYRFVWHGRWLGFRLCAAPEIYDERISYVSFGSFQVGGPDLLCTSRYVIEPVWEDGTATGLGKASPGQLLVPDSTAAAGEYLVRYGDRLSMRLRFSTVAPHIRLTISPGKTDNAGRLLFPFTGRGIFTDTWQGARAAAYYSPALNTGLLVSGGEEAGVVVEGDRRGYAKATCRMPPDRESTWCLTVLDASSWPCVEPDVASPQPEVAATGFAPVAVPALPKWECRMLAAGMSAVQRTGTQERVAGVYLTSPEGGHALSPDPGGSLEHVERRFLDELIATGAFQAVGFSRDGRNFQPLNDRWLHLVERVHAAGLRAYMKPGDGELHGRAKGAALAAWAEACFPEKAEQQVDVVRLCWEAVLSPWVTADLCLSDAAIPPDAKDWTAIRARIAGAVADRFSRIIDAIRGRAPRVTIDLECGDTVVFEKLLGRHENLGVMYMCYGPYPRVGDYLDLYATRAREQFRTSRVVLETDCYYTARYDALGTLYRQPAEGMYSDDEIANMADKHRHMNALASQAAWAWGINICNTPRKFAAICRARSAP